MNLFTFLKHLLLKKTLTRQQIRYFASIESKSLKWFDPIPYSICSNLTPTWRGGEAVKRCVTTLVLAAITLIGFTCMQPDPKLPHTDYQRSNKRNRRNVT